MSRAKIAQEPVTAENFLSSKGFSGSRLSWIYGGETAYLLRQLEGYRGSRLNYLVSWITCSHIDRGEAIFSFLALDLIFFYFPYLGF